MKIKVSEIYNEFAKNGLLIEMQGADTEILSITSVEKAGPGSLVFVDHEKYISQLEKKQPGAAVVSEKLKDAVQQRLKFTVIFCKNVGLANALIRQKFGDRDLRKTEWENVHSSSVIHKTAVLSEGVIVGPNAVIGANVRIGNNSVIMANTVIESGTSIGNETVVHPGCIVGYDSKIGNRVIIKSGSVIGSEGFGYAQDENHRSYRIPQTGIVVIEDDVAIGANNCIDRAAFEETRIRRGTKTDNLCHIAHNVDIGEDCLLTAGFVVAGSTKIGNRVIASGQTGILDHLNICDDVVLVHRAGVTENIEKPGVYAGLPILPLRIYMKNLAIYRKIDELRKAVLNLSKK